MSISIERIRQRTSIVGVVGLGYVGLPLSMVFAEAGFKVIGFDIDPVKVEMLRGGRTYIKHIDEPRLRDVIDGNFFHATCDYSQIENCDAVIICVPTPLDHHLQPNLDFITSTIESLAGHLQLGSLVAIESTTWPGTTIEIAKPLLEKFGKDIVVGDTLYLCFSPEREDPGNVDYNTKTIPKLVGGYNIASRELAVALYQAAIDTVIPVSSTQIAEMAKLFENIFRCVNIAMVNEMKVILDRMGIDIWEVIRAASTKPFGFMPFYPGPGLGGHCIPLDPFYFSWKAKEFGINARFIELAGEINRSMPQYVASKVQDCLNQQGKALKGSRVLILGIAYKANVDDLRESPGLELIAILEGKGAVVSFNDPFISIIPHTREYNLFSGRKSVPISNNFDCLLISANHREYRAEEILSLQIPVVDTRNVLPRGPLVYPA
jgi:UDP-N-acetyl-D-glucosamine dehydrogenase